MNLIRNYCFLVPIAVNLTQLETGVYFFHRRQNVNLTLFPVRKIVIKEPKTHFPCRQIGFKRVNSALTTECSWFLSRRSKR